MVGSTENSKNELSSSVSSSFDNNHSHSSPCLLSTYTRHTNDDILKYILNQALNDKREERDHFFSLFFCYITKQQITSKSN